MLGRLLTTLERRKTLLTIEEMVQLLSMPISVDELQQWMHFEKDKYVRSSMQKTETSEVLLLCWEPGQKCPIHNHFDSSSALRVIEGTATETIYQYVNGVLTPQKTHKVSQGEIRVETSDLIHEFGNPPEALSPMITLHVYSPPLPLAKPGSGFAGGKLIAA